MFILVSKASTVSFREQEQVNRHLNSQLMQVVQSRNRFKMGMIVLYTARVPITSQTNLMGWNWVMILIIIAMSSILTILKTMMETMRMEVQPSTPQSSARAKSVAYKTLLTNTLKCSIIWKAIKLHNLS